MRQNAVLTGTKRNTMVRNKKASTVFLLKKYILIKEADEEFGHPANA